MSYLVDTPKEICEKQTRQFVRAVVERDWPTFDGMMESGIDFKFVGIPWQIEGRDNLSGAVKADIEQIGLKSATATDVTAADAEGAITVAMKVWSNQDYTMGTPLDSEWELDCARPEAIGCFTKFGRSGCLGSSRIRFVGR